MIFSASGLSFYCGFLYDCMSRANVHVSDLLNNSSYKSRLLIVLTLVAEGCPQLAAVIQLLAATRARGRDLLLKAQPADLRSNLNSSGSPSTPWIWVLG